MTESINWAELMQASGGANEPLPPGDYDVQVVKSEATKSQNGKTMFKLTLNVVAGPHTNRKIWTNLVISPENPNALGMFFAQMKAFGLGSEYFAQQPAPEHVASALDGRYARVGVKQRTWQGQVRNEVVNINPAVIQGGQGAIPTVASPAVPAGIPQAAPAPVAAAPVAPVQPPIAAQPNADVAQPAPPAAPAPVQEAPVAQAPAPVVEAPAAPAPVPEQPVAAPASAPAPAPVQEQPQPQAGAPVPPPLPF